MSHENRYSLFGTDGSYLPELISQTLPQTAIPDPVTGDMNYYLFGDAYTSLVQQLTNANAGKTMYNPVMSDYVVTDQCLEDGSFLRLNQLTIGYSFPKDWMEKTKVINNIRVYVQGTNLFVATKYSGLDPEVDTRSSKNPLTPGVDFSAYPKSRGINVGLNIQF